MRQKTKEFLEKIAQKKAQRAASAAHMRQKKADKIKAEQDRIAAEKLAAKEAARLAAEEAARPRIESPPPPPNVFRVPRWLASPTSPYYAPELVADPNEYRIQFIGKDGEPHWRSHPGPQTHALLCGFEELVVGGRRGGGKAQSLDSKVLTPFGFVEMRDVKIGTTVINPDGSHAKVIAIHPQGPKDMFSITFIDGATTKCTGDHLWLAKETCRQTKASRAYFPFGDTEKVGFKVFTTDQLRRDLYKKTAASTNLLIPLTEEVVFTHVSNSRYGCPIDPYVLGVLLGDGCLRSENSVNFTSADDEIVESMECRTGLKFTRIGPFGFRSRAGQSFVTSMKQLGIHRHLAEDKFIPDRYKTASVDVRRDVIRGLMDTDGYVDSRGHCSFTTTSIHLAKDVQWVCWSLGYKASLKTGPAGYKDKQGTFIPCKDAHTVYIQGKRTADLFNLRRKKERCRDTFNGGVSVPCRRIVKIEPCGVEEAQCITVDHPNGLYITDDFIVTHNSAFLIAKGAMGDQTLAPDDPARFSYLNDRDFRGLYLREQYQGLSEFIEHAIQFFRPFGGKGVGDPKHIDFPSGARIYFNHLQDEEAFNKYKGWNLTFIGIEELTNIRTLQQYLKLLGSLRSAPRNRVVMGPDGRPLKKTFPGLRTQIVSTTNPDGPGAPWVKERFVKVNDSLGNPIPWGTPMIDPITKSHRIFIPFPIEANPTLATTTTEGRRYWSMLMSQDTVTRKQWIEGDWDAGSSLFFTEYRPDGPVGAEEESRYPWARHRIKPVNLQPWWHRWGSGDYGYDHPAAFHKACRNESDHRVHIYDEMTMRQVGAFEQGARLAQWWMPELQMLQKAGQDPCIVINLGDDIFRKTDIEKTLAQQMEAGVKEVLGPYGAILLKYDEAEKEAMARNPKMAQEMFRRRVASLHGQMCLALKPTWMDRVAAWSYMRELIRFRPAVLNLQTDAEREAYLREVLKTEGRERYEYESEKLRNIKPEILPKVLFWDRCIGIDRCLKVAQRDTRNDNDPTKPSKSDDVLKFNATEGENGDDELESVRNLLFAYKTIETTMPLSYFVAEKMQQAQNLHQEAYGAPLTDPTRLAMIAQTQIAKYNQQNAPSKKSFTFARASSQRHRVQ